jgi:DNA helicase-2/ATP-dependent DNA helicase PcrA
VRSGVRFFEQAHIKDVVAYLRIIVNPRDELAWKRILKLVPGVGNATANRIYELVAAGRVSARELGFGSLAYADQPPSAPAAGPDEAAALSGTDMLNRLRSFGGVRNRKSFDEFVRLMELLVQDENRDNPAKQIELVMANGYEQYLVETYENAEARTEDLKGLALFAQRYQSTEDFLSELALLSTERFKEPQPLVGEDVIEGPDEDEMLTLTSVHQAKGLEWKSVFIIWAAEGKFPSPRSLREIDSEEEERRLWYVALTRAKDELYLTYPLLMTDYNRQTVLQKPSRFITECPPDLFEIWDLEEELACPPSDTALPPSTDEYIN